MFPCWMANRDLKCSGESVVTLWLLPNLCLCSPPLKAVARVPHSLATAYFSNLTTTLLQDCSPLRGGSCVFLPPCLCLSWEVSTCLPALHLPGRFKSEPTLFPACRALSPLLCFHRPMSPAQDLYSDILPQVVYSYLSQASVNVLSVKTISLHLCIP